MTSPLLLRRLSLLCALILCCVGPLRAQNLGNAYHVPDSAELNGTHMRNPEFEIGTNTPVTIYSGNQFQGNGNPGNQTGGFLYYKTAGGTSWTSVGLAFDSQNGNNKYWQASFNTSQFGADDVIQYYLEVDYSDHATTYVYGGDNITQTTASQTTAAASPYTIRNRAAFLFHDNNRVVNGTSVQFWTKVGYIGKDQTPASQYVDHGALYYTTDGSNPSGSLGVAGSGTTTTVVPLALDHLEDDYSIAGNDMWWLGTANNLPTYTTIKYKIGLWNSSNNEEKFADYNTNGTNAAIFSFTIGTVGSPTLTVNGVSADYTTTHVFVNEINNDQIPLSIFFDPASPNADPSTVEVYTNLNRRDYASQQYTDSNGILTEEGIEPPSGDVVGTDDNHYYKAYAMSPAAGGGYALTLSAQKTGAYRLTARYKLTSTISPNPNPWIYYTMNGLRDHALVVSPTQARDIQLYELNALNVDASGDQPSQRSTFADLAAGTKRWNLNYLKNLGCNWVWFQPIHPNGIDGRQTDPNTGAPFTVGSPYSVKNFFEVMPLMGSVTNFAGSTDPNANDPNPVAPTDPSYASSPRGLAKHDFINFMTAADNAGVGVMLDAPFNHTSFDVEMGTNGAQLFSPSSGASYTSQIRNVEARFFSQSGDYALRASSASNIALAPDRDDFGKFDDVHDIYFGTYSALVDINDADNGYYLNEGDQFFGYLGSSPYPNGDPNWNSVDFTTTGGTNNNITRNVWHYFAQYVPYWLGQTGHGDANGNPYGNSTNPDPVQRLAEDSKGIDGLRADFGQGLPPQCWEYIINVARSYKWNFVFMTESLDGGQVTYRSNRHFDILNEDIVFPFQSASVAQDYRNIFDQRRASYGQGLILMNSTSHDEENYADPFEALIRYMVSGTIDGVPMIFYGQENGISSTFGFDHYELNFGKEIPHFKVFNSLGPVLGNQTFALQQLYPDFAAVGQGREFSPALRSSNRYYLNQTDGTMQNEIFSVGKYQTANASPGVSDVVFGFVNLDRNNSQAGNFNVNITQNGSNLFGITSGRIYNVRNIAAYLGGTDQTRRNTFLIPGNVTGDNLLANGLYVALNPVPTTNDGWNSAPFEAQYLKLYDVTPPPSDSAPTVVGTALDTTATFSWQTVTDNLGGISGYRLEISTDPAGSHLIFNSIIGNVTSYTITNAGPGETLYARVDAVNNAGVEGPLSAASNGVTVLESLSYWEGNYSITNINATPFNDGVADLLKYLFDINPTVPMSAADRAALPAAGTDTTTTPGTTYLTMTYRQYALETGITINVQSSVDLHAWSTITPDFTKQTGTDPNTGDPIMEVGVKVTGSRLFLRLSVTSP
jgi:hypothetical protein